VRGLLHFAPKNLPEVWRLRLLIEGVKVKTIENIDPAFVLWNSRERTGKVYNFGVEDAYGMEKGYLIETFRLKGDDRFAFQAVATRTSLGLTNPRGAWSPVYLFSTVEERDKDIQRYVKAAQRRAKKSAID
jgi:hypothetical protein